MIIREANVNDIQQIQVVRNSVNENKLSNPNLVTDEDCIEYHYYKEEKAGFVKSTDASLDFLLQI